MAETVLWAADELRLAIGRQTIYDGAEFYINAGERVALVGRNGSGKSTLLRLITGDEIPSSGNITRARNLRVAVLPQDFEVDDGRTIRETSRTGSRISANCRKSSKPSRSTRPNTRRSTMS